MADPVIPDVYRAQVRVPGPTGLPHDVYVNTFAFRNDQIVSVAPGEMIGRALTAFYGHLSTYLASGHALWPQTELRVYDLGQQPPRQPEILEMPLVGGTGGTPYPTEVAACLSFYAERNLPRRRGRVYIGPVTSTASQTTEGVVTPGQPFRQALIDAGADLVGTTEDITWGLVSQVDQSFHVVTNLWVDNAWDTQRRRGVEPTQRTVWPVPA